MASPHPRHTLGHMYIRADRAQDGIVSLSSARVSWRLSRSGVRRDALSACQRASADPRPSRSARQRAHRSLRHNRSESGGIPTGPFPAASLVRPERQTRTPQRGFLDMPYVARWTFKGIDLRQAVESWGSSEESHGLSAPWTTRRHGGRSGGAFVAHDRTRFSSHSFNVVRLRG
jgi:hypothetical protein